MEYNALLCLAPSIPATNNNNIVFVLNGLLMRVKKLSMFY